MTGLPTLGTVTLADGTAVTDGQILTSAQLTGLQYDAPAEYNGTDTVGTFTYTVDDGESTPNSVQTGTVTINVAAVNDAPVLTGDLSATVKEGESYTLTTTDLGFTDPDDGVADVTFTLSNLSNGKVQVSGNDATSFTFAQLATGEVTFIHDGSETTEASFDVNVEDGNEDNSIPTDSTFNFTVIANEPASIFINGSMNVGDTLTAVISDADGVPDSSEVQYQWMISDDNGQTWAPIENATESSYTLPENDAGKLVSVRASFTDNNGFTESPVAVPVATAITVLTLNENNVNSSDLTFTAKGGDITYQDNSDEVNVGNNLGPAPGMGIGIEGSKITPGESLDIDFTKKGKNESGVKDVTIQMSSINRSNEYFQIKIYDIDENLVDTIDYVPTYVDPNTDTAFAENTIATISLPVDSGIAVGSIEIAPQSGVIPSTGEESSTYVRLYSVTYTARNPDIVGDSGDNTLAGGNSGEIINGLAGDDTLEGFGGDDRLVGGQGDDTLSGGDGRDVFEFSSADLTTSPTVDTITDFVLGDRSADLDGNFANNHADALDWSDFLSVSDPDNLTVQSLLNAGISVETVGDATSDTVIRFADNSQQLDIVLKNVGWVDLTQDGTVSSEEVLQQLIDNGQIII